MARYMNIEVGKPVVQGVVIRVIANWGRASEELDPKRAPHQLNNVDGWWATAVHHFGRDLVEVGRRTAEAKGQIPFVVNNGAGRLPGRMANTNRLLFELEGGRNLELVIETESHQKAYYHRKRAKASPPPPVVAPAPKPAKQPEPKLYYDPTLQRVVQRSDFGRLYNDPDEWYEKNPFDRDRLPEWSEEEEAHG